MQKAIYAALLIVILFATWGGYIGYRHHVDNQAIDAAVPAVKNTSLRVANALKLFTQPSNATYKELFDKADADVAELDKKHLDVQTAATPSTEKWMSAIGAYLVASQDVLRAEAGMYRKKLLAESAFEQSQQAARRYAQASSIYETRFLVASRDESLAEERKRVGEFQDATKTMNAALTKLSEARDSLTTFVPGDALIDPALLEEARKRVK
jgi:hypothetical protein